MRFDAVIDLGAVTLANDAIGQEVETVAWRTVYANRFSLSSDAFYSAGRAGLKPECVYQLRACEYQGEPYARAGGVVYDVIRTDDRGEWVRLTLQRTVGNG